MASKGIIFQNMREQKGRSNLFYLSHLYIDVLCVSISEFPTLSKFREPECFILGRFPTGIQDITSSLLNPFPIVA